MILLLVALLTGCLTSDQPLIRSGVFPVADGMRFQHFRYERGAYVADLDQEGRVEEGQLAIEDDWYVYRPHSGAVEVYFRLSRIDQTDHLIMYRTSDDGRYWRLLYGLMRQQDGYYLIYTFGAAHLEHHTPLESHQPEWSPRGDSLAAVGSAEFLKRVLPEMVERNLHVERVLAFWPISEEPVRFGTITETAW